MRRALILAAVLAASAADAADIPRDAYRHRAELTRSARLTWGLDAPVATFAAQIHQESHWNPEAKSSVGAQGMAQVMPATATWLATTFPSLADKQPKTPAWSMRALVTYDRWLWDRVKADNECDRMAKATSGYNGGLGWVYRDEAVAQRAGLDRNRWWGNVETVNAGRMAAAWKENRDYPRRILRMHEPSYVAAGFGRGVCA